MSVGVIFPGQGSQRPGMLSELAAQYALVTETFAEASDSLGLDLWQRVQSGSEAELADTRLTQPVMYVSGIAVWRVLRHAGLPMPQALAGHSLGEISALVAGEVLSFADGCRLVQRRAELMAAAVPDGTGGMAALIGLDDDQVIALCEALNGERVVEAVNFNAPGQVVVSGHLDAVQKLVALAQEEGARRAMVLPVSVPNHSALMREAGEALMSLFDELQWHDSAVPVVQNIDASVSTEAQALRGRLESHVFSPVQWTRVVASLRDQCGVDTVIEAGPGKVLCGLNKRIDRKLKCIPVEDPAGVQTALDATREQDPA